MAITFRELSADDAEMVGTWRASHRVDENFLIHFEYDAKKQREWLESSFDRADFYHWIILNDERPIGHIQLSNIESENKISEWGFFIGDESAIGLGSQILAPFYSFCFRHLGLHRLRVQCLHTNTRVIALHQLYGYRFSQELSFPIVKQGKEFFVIGMTLDRDAFMTGRFNRFDVLLPTEKWAANPFVGSEETFPAERV
jgi:UDP-4-amino-4,6-dideoxy-N-acetyl-beta-L-altrosamine N-acetyltransferase